MRLLAERAGAARRRCRYAARRTVSTGLPRRKLVCKPVKSTYTFCL
jgi:hypothetical protein